MCSRDRRKNANISTEIKSFSRVPKGTSIQDENARGRDRLHFSGPWDVPRPKWTSLCPLGSLEIIIRKHFVMSVETFCE